MIPRHRRLIEKRIKKQEINCIFTSNIHKYFHNKLENYLRIASHHTFYDCVFIFFDILHDLRIKKSDRFCENEYKKSANKTIGNRSPINTTFLLLTVHNHVE